MNFDIQGTLTNRISITKEKKNNIKKVNYIITAAISSSVNSFSFFIDLCTPTMDKSKNGNPGEKYVFITHNAPIHTTCIKVYKCILLVRT